MRFERERKEERETHRQTDRQTESESETERLLRYKHGVKNNFERSKRK